ncbi:FAD/NAD(P)-binding domain-containing protein [Aaosphaeria arxii CBS 175.79]|uniref:FAD/NAD(P)-binding domain-containing protein n=1 Tax=Aaosphaeria arxii CBS 175.79 TaxID=1450172 RepID=A0A6A5Y047_9PLEO|nr:FAD/NAD(P)-binding domain-containing protein [Aaosphaeria arxii CBS 175.79]KAF2018586.1 FAD/NAD(P)-binding domain-containing protein [Aaosphaeria arxii CBS 175.79]
MTTDFSIRAAYAQKILREHVLQKFNLQHGTNRDELPELPPQNSAPKAPPIPGTIGIIGAGTAGLQVALILLACNITNFEMLEASDDVGGRAHTIKFPKDETCPHNYYDAGAMRIPDIGGMDRHVYNWLGLREKKVTYNYTNKKEPSMYLYQSNIGDVEKRNAKIDERFKNVMRAKGVGEGFLNAKTETEFEAAFEEFLDGLKDNFSTRSFLMTGLGLIDPFRRLFSYGETVVAETFETSTGLFDQALLETIIDFCDFEATKDVKWYRMEGGMSTVPYAMRDYILKQTPNAIEWNAPVVALADSGSMITATLQNGTKRQYTYVFNTTPMSCLGQMDLSGLNIGPLSAMSTIDQNPLTAIRTLAYDRATKVAIKFKTPWWETIVPDGGVSNTDLPIGNVVYPSWNDGSDTPHVIIVSYTWAQDATRMASLITDASKSGEYNPDDYLVQLCFRDLALLWKDHGGPSASDLEKSYEAHSAWSWSQNPWSCGAYALFAPGQFKHMYNTFTKPLCNNKLMVCGEAISAHHAWISGALDSAYNACLAWAHAIDSTGGLANAITATPFGGGKDHDTKEYDSNLWRHHVALS